MQDSTSAKPSQHTQAAAADEGLRLQLAAQREANARLQARLDQQDADLAAEGAAAAAIGQGLREALAGQEAAAAALQAQLDSRPTAAQVSLPASCCSSTHDPAMVQWPQ